MSKTVKKIKKKYLTIKNGKTITISNNALFFFRLPKFQVVQRCNKFETVNTLLLKKYQQQKMKRSKEF